MALEVFDAIQNKAGRLLAGFLADKRPTSGLQRTGRFAVFYPQ